MTKPPPIEPLVANAQDFLRSLFVLKEMRAIGTLIKAAQDMRDKYVEAMTYIDVLTKELADLRAANDSENDGRYMNVYAVIDGGRQEVVGRVLAQAMSDVRRGGFSIGGEVRTGTLTPCGAKCCEGLCALPNFHTGAHECPLCQRQ